MGDAASNFELVIFQVIPETYISHCLDVGALFLKPSHRQGMKCSYETYSNRTWSFCQSNCTLVGPGIEMINHIHFCQTRYVDGTPTSEVTPVTIRYIRPPQHGDTSHC